MRKRTHVGDRQAEVRSRQRMELEKVSGCIAAGRVIASAVGNFMLEFTQKSERCLVLSDIEQKYAIMQWHLTIGLGG